MNEVKTRVVDTNCSKQLKFGVERILSDEISSKKTGNGMKNGYLSCSSNYFLYFHQLTRFSKKVIVMKWTSYCPFDLHGQLLNKYICFERCTKAASGTIFHGAVSLSWRLRQVRSPTNLPSIFLRSNCDFRKLRKYQPWKRSSGKLYQYLSTGSTSTCSQR